MVTAPSRERVAASQEARVLLTWGDGPGIQGWLTRPPGLGSIASDPPLPAPPDLAASPDGRLLAVANLQGSGGVDLLDLATGARLRRFDAGGAVDALAFSPGGEALAATVPGEGLTVWDLVTGAVRWRWSGRADPSPVEWLGDDVITVTDAGEVVVLSGADGAERRRIPALPGRASTSGECPVARGSSSGPAPRRSR